MNEGLADSFSTAEDAQKIQLIKEQSQLRLLLKDLNILFDEAIANQEQVKDQFPKTEAQFKIPPNAENILDFQIEAC